jgi:hypothetical protein
MALPALVITAPDSALTAGAGGQWPSSAVAERRAKSWRCQCLGLVPDPRTLANAARPAHQPTEPFVPEFERWGDAARLVAQSEHLHRLMCTLSLDIDVTGFDAGDPAVVKLGCQPAGRYGFNNR